MALKYEDTQAALMLSEAFRDLREKRVSIRSLGYKLGYRQPTTLSHMATGRIMVPIERALNIADVTGIDRSSFCVAVLRQRDPAFAEAVLSHGQPDARRSKWLALRKEACRLAERLWRINPSEITAMVPPVTREEYYAAEIKSLLDKAF